MAITPSGLSKVLKDCRNSNVKSGMGSAPPVKTNVVKPLRLVLGRPCRVGNGILNHGRVIGGETKVLDSIFINHGVDFDNRGVYTVRNEGRRASSDTEATGRC